MVGSIGLEKVTSIESTGVFRGLATVEKLWTVGGTVSIVQATLSEPTPGAAVRSVTWLALTVRT